jgi:hypothetical protein
MAFVARAINKARDVGFAPMLLLVIGIFFLGMGRQVFLVLLAWLCWRAGREALAALRRGSHQPAPQASARRASQSPPTTKAEYRRWLLRCTHIGLPADDQPLEFYRSLYEEREEHAARAPPAAGVARAGDAARAPAPPWERSLGTARLLWAAGPPLGLHHAYLWNDASFLLHLCTGGGFGLAWLYDGFILPSLVHTANASVAAGSDTKEAAPPAAAHTSAAGSVFVDGAGRVCSRAVALPRSRVAAMVLAGSYLGSLFGAALPPGLAPLGRSHPLLDPSWAAHALGAALGAWLAAADHSRRCSARAAAVAAAAGAIVASLHARQFLRLIGPFLFTFSPPAYHLTASVLLPFTLRYCVVPAAAAAAACAATCRPAPPIVPRRRRPPRATALRALLVCGCAVGVWLATWHGARMGRLPLLVGMRDAARHAASGDAFGAWAELRRAAGVSGGTHRPAARVSDPAAARAAARALLGLRAEGELTPAEVKAGHRAAALSTHPDKLPASATDEDRAEAAACFTEMQQAFELLRGEGERQGKAEAARRGRTAPAGAPAAPRAPAAQPTRARDEL